MVAATMETIMCDTVTIEQIRAISVSWADEWNLAYHYGLIIEQDGELVNGGIPADDFAAYRNFWETEFDGD